jgi:hypothetical protein
MGTVFFSILYSVFQFCLLPQLDLTFSHQLQNHTTFRWCVYLVFFFFFFLERQPDCLWPHLLQNNDN